MYLQLFNQEGILKGETIQYIYTDSKHNNPLRRVVPIENLASLPHMIKKNTKKWYLMRQKQFLGFLGLIGVLTAILRGIIEEKSGII